MPRTAKGSAANGLASARAALREERSRLLKEIGVIENALEALGGPGRPRKRRRRKAAKRGRRRGPGRPPKRGRRGPGRPPKRGRRRGPGRPRKVEVAAPAL